MLQAPWPERGRSLLPESLVGRRLNRGQGGLRLQTAGSDAGERVVERFCNRRGRKALVLSLRQVGHEALVHFLYVLGDITLRLMALKGWKIVEVVQRFLQADAVC